MNLSTAQAHEWLTHIGHRMSSEAHTYHRHGFQPTDDRHELVRRARFLRNHNLMIVNSHDIVREVLDTILSWPEATEDDHG
jgi:hypothetical protein